MCVEATDIFDTDGTEYEIAVDTEVLDVSVEGFSFQATAAAGEVYGIYLEFSGLTQTGSGLSNGEAGMKTEFDTLEEDVDSTISELKSTNTAFATAWNKVAAADVQTHAMETDSEALHNEV